MTPISLPLHRIARRSLLALGGAMLAASAWSQAGWPGGKLITWVVPYPAGGSTDVLGRNIAQRLGPALATNVIVDNKAGATGTIAGGINTNTASGTTATTGTSVGATGSSTNSDMSATAGTSATAKAKAKSKKNKTPGVDAAAAGNNNVTGTTGDLTSAQTPH